MSEDTKILEDIGEYKYGFHDRDDNYTFKSQKGLSREVVENISRMKGEPQWMLEFRLKALDHFLKRPMPNWGPSLKELNFDKIYFYVKPTEKSEKSWDDVPDDIKRTFDKLGVPEAERKFLAGLGAQYESEMVYHSIQEHLEKQGVIFLSIEDGLKQYPDLFREYFGTVIPIEDNKFAALNSAVWSGGSFVYVPKNVKVDLPLQAYFRLNTANLGQFERTLIIVDEGASVHYVEGCTAPQYTTNSFHSGVIEIIVKKGARSRYSTIQNWSTNVYNLVTQRAKVFENASHEWVDANIGSKITMKYPSCYLMEPAHAAKCFRWRLQVRVKHRMRAARCITSRRIPPARSRPSPSARAVDVLRSVVCSRFTKARRASSPIRFATRFCSIRNPARIPIPISRSTKTMSRSVTRLR